MRTVKNLFAAARLKQEFAERRDKLYRLAYSWCHNAALADDLVQETMLKALKNADRLRNHDMLDTWLYRILLNNWHDHLRVQGRNAELYDVGDESQPGGFCGLQLCRDRGHRRYTHRYRDEPPAQSPAEFEGAIARPGRRG